MYWIFQFFRRFGFTLIFKFKFFRWNGHQILPDKLDMVLSQKPKIAIILLTNFQNITKKNMGSKHLILHNNHFKTHLFFFQFLGGGTLFSSDPGPKGGSNLKALWRSHLTSARRPISYRIRFMARRSFFIFSRLVENSTIFFFFWTLPLLILLGINE